MPRPKPIEAWHNSPLSMRFTLTQRVTLRRLGGVAWLREQIDKQAKEFMQNPTNALTEASK